MQELDLCIFDKHLFASRWGVGANFGSAFHEQRLLYLTVSYIHCVQYLENLRKIFGKNVTSASCFNMVVIDECKLLFCHIRSYFYLISLPWKYASRGITWSRLSFRYCQTSYISFFHTKLKLEWVQVYNALSFVDWSEILFQLIQSKGMVSMLIFDCIL